MLIQSQLLALVLDGKLKVSIEGGVVLYTPENGEQESEPVPLEVLSTTCEAPKAPKGRTAPAGGRDNNARGGTPLLKVGPLTAARRVRAVRAVPAGSSGE